MSVNTKVNPVNLLALREGIKHLSTAEDYESMKLSVQELESYIGTSDEMNENDRFLMLTILAAYYRNVNHYDKSASFSRQAINLSKNLDEAHTGVLISTYLDYAGLVREYGQLADARILLAKLLQLLEKKKWHDPFAFGLTYSNLGKVYIDEENTQLGIYQLEKALEYFREACADTHPIVPETIQAISDASIQMEDYQRALTHYQDLLKAYKKENDRVSEAKMCMKVGEVYYYIDLKKAREMITEALGLFEAVYDSSHMDIAKAYLMLAELEESVGEFSQSVHYYKQSLSELEDIYKENHVLKVFTYSKLGNLSIQLNELDMAKTYLEEGLALSGKFPKLRRQFLYKLGTVYSNKQMYDQANSLYLEFLQFLEKDGRNKSKGFAQTLEAVAFNFLKLNNLEDAITYYSEALSVYEQLKGNYSGEKGWIHIHLGYCFENKQDNDIALAETYLEKGISLLEKVPDQRMLDEIYADAIEFFTRFDNEEKRRKYKEKSAQVGAGNL